MSAISQSRGPWRNVLAQLGSERVLIVTSPEGADEMTLTGPNSVVDYDRDRGTVKEYAVDPARLRAVACGTRRESVVATRPRMPQ